MWNGTSSVNTELCIVRFGFFLAILFCFIPNVVRQVKFHSWNGFKKLSSYSPELSRKKKINSSPLKVSKTLNRPLITWIRNHNNDTIVYV